MRLRARLAEVEAEWDKTDRTAARLIETSQRFVEKQGKEKDALAARAEVAEAERDAALAGSREIRGALLDAEARLAEVEAKLRARDEMYELAEDRAEAAEARLAAVLALCDEDARREPMFRGWLETHKVRAAAAGDDRGRAPVPYCPDCDLGAGHTGPHMQLPGVSSHPAHVKADGNSGETPAAAGDDRG